MGWKSLFNEKLVQHPIVKSKLSQGLMMMNRSVSGSTVSYQQTQHPVTSNAVASKPAQEEKLAQSASLPSISSFKELIERKAVENNILFVQIPNRFKEGKQIYRFGNLNVYIDRNVLFMLLNGTWIPASINDILQKTL
jgi:tuftelin-interacting protein 11